ncbi:MAG TPA: transcriptional regulator GcvA [Casimicrobiaceae bacterium]|nr:transcriptional regulator GcvA [Casimicrobiaceae bacterium]
MTRRLPPLNAVRAFEASARHASFTRAAQELFVTQGAVSRHVAALEKWLGIKLFTRTQRGIELTPKGSVYFRTLRGALDQIDYGTRQLQQTPDENTLRLKLPPTFAIRWLVPRLARFLAADRQIDVQITTSHQPVDFDREDVDACIHSGAAPPPDAVSRRLFGEILLPVCSPALLGRGPPLAQPADLAQHVLLCSLHRPQDWPTWLAAARISDIDGNSGLKFENSALSYQAAIEGVGVVVAQRAFIEDDLRAGRLVAPFALRAPTTGSYYLAYRAQRQKPARVDRFEDWILREVTGLEEASVAPGMA